MYGDEEALLLELDHLGRTAFLGRGEPSRVRALVEGSGAERVAWMTLPRRGAGPAGVAGEPSHEGPRHRPEDDLDPVTQRGLGLYPISAWDWMATSRRPEADGGQTVVRLDPSADAGAVLDCLAEANPGTSADPRHEAEAAWFGVRDGATLLGVIGAESRRGRPAARDLSWHLHGLAVRREARGRGLGGALTAAATTAGFDAGADWVSLGMYASNDVARRVYRRLGFDVEGRFTSYRPPGSRPGEPARR